MADDADVSLDTSVPLETNVLVRWSRRVAGGLLTCSVVAGHDGLFTQHGICTQEKAVGVSVPVAHHLLLRRPTAYRESSCTM